MNISHSAFWFHGSSSGSFGVGGGHFVPGFECLWFIKLSDIDGESRRSLTVNWRLCSQEVILIINIFLVAFPLFVQNGLHNFVVTVTESKHNLCFQTTANAQEMVHFHQFHS